MNLLIDGPTALFGRLVDYAGLFPPASLSLEAAAAEYRNARMGKHAWMLGRFLCPTSRLEDLAGLLTTSMVVGEMPWSVGAIVDEAPGVGALHAQVFDRHMTPAARIDVVEARLPPEVSDAGSLEEAIALIRPIAEAIITISPEVVPYLEVAHTSEWERGLGHAVAAIAELRRQLLRKLGAKFRTGGTTREAFPTTAEVARFIYACEAAGVEYKATAGLHNPLRHHDPDLDVMRHGFLNLLGAAALAKAGADEGDLTGVLDETDPTRFAVGPGGLQIDDRRISIPTLRAMRSELFPAYGSCSFDEPVEELIALGMVK